MPVLVPASGFTQQLEEFAKQLTELSDEVEVGDDKGDPTRMTSFLVEIAGPSGVLATFDYREAFERERAGWLRSGYWYELRYSRPFRRDLHSRRAHHEHEERGIHQHCEAPTSPDHHYVDVERLLQATHELFVEQYATGTPIGCAGLVRVTKV